MTGAALLTLATLVTSSAFPEGLVPDESGFKGAVKVVSATEEDGFAIVLAEVPFLDVYGKDQLGLARLVIQREALEKSGSLPAFCFVHYEMDVAGAQGIAREGWVHSTAVYDAAHPIDTSVGNGNNLARAILQWVRRLPFVDRSRLHIDGGSQGGYMALAMSADNFPVTSTTADVPVVNWAYNFSYFVKNKPATKYPVAFEESPLPIMCMVTGLADQSMAYFGNDLGADAWYYLSPIAYLDRIANPVLVTSVTGDMLVPMEQMSRTHFVPHDPTRFPEGYVRDFDTLTVCKKARKVFEECIPAEETFIHVEPLQENSFEVTFDLFQHPEKKPDKRPEVKQKTWSKDHQWSLSYANEGPPLPGASHVSFKWAMVGNSFWQYYRDAVPAPDILNKAKLKRLMERYEGRLSNLPKLKDGTPVHRLNYPALEQRDVLMGLADYATLGETHRARLLALCEALKAPKVFREAASMAAAP